MREDQTRRALTSNALLEMYTGVFLIDLVKNRFFPVKCDNRTQDILKNMVTADEAITIAMRNTVWPEQIQEMLEFVNLSTLPRRMRTTKSIDRDYRGVISGWVRGSFIEVERDENGALTKVIYAYRLIDEDRRQALEQKRRENLRQEIDGFKKEHREAAAGMWSIQFDRKGAVSSCFWSGEARKMLGFDESDRGWDNLDSLLNRVHPEDKERVWNVFRATVCDGTGENAFDLECRIYLLNGQYHWFRIYGQMLEQPEGEERKFEGFIVNMDEKHATFDVLCRVLDDAEAAKNRALLENEIISSVSRMYFSIFRIDLLHDFYEEVSSDQSVHLITGKNGKAQEKMNEICRGLVDPDYQELVAAFFDLSTVPERMANTDTIELEYHASDGNWHEARFIEKKRDGEGHLTHILYVTRIVSKQKQKELEQERLRIAFDIAERANQAKTAFLFNMSHDIRTPMNAIVGFAQLMKRDYDQPEKVLHYQEKMQQASDFLLSLINNVLDMARIESGRMEPDYECVDVNDGPEQLSGVFEAEAAKKNITLTVTSHFTVRHLMSDVVKTKEIFSNLVSNAIKYTPAGGTVRVTLRDYPGETPDMVNVETIVEDNGIGMSEEFLPHLFDAFERERNTTIGRVPGTGLGMPIVKKLVELLNGTIRVESKLGKGTKYTIVIPHKIAEEEYARAREQQQLSESAAQTLVGKRVLMAEDNDLNAEIAQAILEDMGLRVERAADGIVCVNMLEKAEPDYYDLILMDIQMPNMDGYKATTVIRRIPDKRKAMIPIVAMTANAFDEDKRHALQIGMDAHIGKPIQIDVLKYTLGVVLNREEVLLDRTPFWSKRFVNCDAIRKFEMKHRLLGHPCGWLLYEAYGEEKILYADEVLVRMFGCRDYREFRAYVGGSFRNMVYGEDIDRVENEISQQINDSVDCVDRVQYRILRKDGAVRTIDDIGNKAFIENGIPVFYVCLVDVTDSVDEQENEKK